MPPNLFSSPASPMSWMTRANCLAYMFCCRRSMAWVHREAVLCFSRLHTKHCGSLRLGNSQMYYFSVPARCASNISAYLSTLAARWNSFKDLRCLLIGIIILKTNSDFTVLVRIWYIIYCLSLCSGSVDKDLNHLFAAFLKLQLLSFIFYSFFLNHFWLLGAGWQIHRSVFNMLFIMELRTACPGHS